MTPDLVSIIIPCYNAERYLEATLQSALAQTYLNCEIIVIDDGSTDDSIKILKKYEHQIRWETGPNQGACKARNRGLALAQGEYIQFLDADDLLHPEKIQIHVQILKETGLSLIQSPTHCFRNNEDHYPWEELPHWNDFILSGTEFCILKRLGELNQLLMIPGSNIHFSHSHNHGWLVKAECLKQVGPWNEALHIFQDVEYFERVLLQVPKVYFSGQVLTRYRMDAPNSISKKRTRSHQESLLQYIQFAETILEYDQGLRARIGLARLYYILMRRCIPQHLDIARLSNQRIKELKIPKGEEAYTPIVKKTIRFLGTLPTAWLIYLFKGSA